MPKKDDKRLTTHNACRQCRTGAMCKVLERELSKFNSNLQSKAAKPHLGIENMSAGLEPEFNRDEQALEMAAKLKSYALHDLQIDVVIYSLVYNWNFSEIAEELNIVSWQQTRAIFKQAIELLRERGYK